MSKFLEGYAASLTVTPGDRDDLVEHPLPLFVTLADANPIS